jgi:hypothetical protein
MRLHLGGVGTVTVTPQLQTLAQAIATQENANPSLNNPGNLVYVGQAGATLGPNGFAQFDTYQDGLNALYNQLGLYASGACGACGGQPLTIAQMTAIYAPAGQGNNDPTAYANNLAAAMGVGVNTPVADVIAETAATSATAASTVCYDDDGNVVDCSDPTCATGPCGSSDTTAFAVLGGIALVAAWMILA